MVARRMGRLCWLIVLAGAVSPAQTGSIEGSVTDAVTGQGVRKADVVLRLYADDGAPTVRATTDANGKYRIPGLAAGDYRVSAERQGYSPVVYREQGAVQASQVEVADGQAAAGIDLKMTPLGVISGRIVDQDGDPVAGISVRVLLPRYIDGRRSFAMGLSAQTDDVGKFRISGLTSGRYYLSAVPARRPGAGSERRIGPAEEYVQTFHPGTVDPRLAGQIEVAAGQVVEGLQMTLLKQQTVSVRGLMVDESGIQPGRRAVVLQSTDRATAMAQSYYAPVGADGKFEIRGVTPGSYAAAIVASDGAARAAGAAPVQVGNQDVDNVVLTVERSFEMAGEIRTEGETKPGTDWRVVLAPEIRGLPSAERSGAVKGSGDFTIPDVYAGRYRIGLSTQGNFYVKSVRLGEQDVTDEPVDLRSGGGRVAIVVRDDPGRLEGVVRRGGAVVSNVAVVAVPVSEKVRSNEQTFPNGRSDPQGRFRMRRVTPGEYRLFAWEEVEPGAWTDPEFMKQFESKGKRVTVSAGEVEQVEVELIQAAR